MRKAIQLTFAAVLTMGIATTALATEFTKGKIKKLDEKAGKVTIIHEELKNLDMPAMTMVFKIGKGVNAADLKEGAEIEFSADRVDGKLTVVEIK